MKKIIYASLPTLACITLLFAISSQVEASENNEDNNIVTNLSRGPLTGPDGENLYPGGGPSHVMTNILNDSFNDWNSSIFKRWMGNPVMSRNLLTMPRNSSVNSKPIDFSGNTTYKVTIGNLKGTINFLVWDYANNLVLAERTITSNGSDVSFDYYHINKWPAISSSIIALEGRTDSEATSFRIDRY